MLKQRKGSGLRYRPRCFSRPDDVIAICFAALHESVSGTKQTFHGSVPMSAFGGKADMLIMLANVCF